MYGVSSLQAYSCEFVPTIKARTSHGHQVLTGQPAPVQVTSCQALLLPCPSVSRRGCSPPDRNIPPTLTLPLSRQGLASLFCSFIKAGRATAYSEDQWFGFSYSDDPVSGCALTLLRSRHHSPPFSLALSVLWVQNEVLGVGRGEWETPRSPWSAVQRSPVLKGHQGGYCKWLWSPALRVLDPDVAVSWLLTGTR